MERILIMLNPSSGKGIPAEFEKQIKRGFSGKEFDFRMIELDEDNPEEQVRTEINKFLPTIAVGAGGDGTISMVAGAIIGTDISLGIIPLGSANALAYQFGIPDDPARAMDIILSEKSKPVDVIQINGKHLCLHMSDLGMNARVIRRYERENIRGLYGYAKQYMRELGNRNKFRVTISGGDGKRHTTSAVMVVLANGPYYGTGAKVAQEGKPDDGWFEVIAIKAYPFWFLFYMLVSIFTGKVDADRFSKHIRCREARVHVDPPQDMQIDGEIIGTCTEVVARILPGKLKVLSPG
jgi:diacylglycerol kinase (ATP)